MWGGARVETTWWGEAGRGLAAFGSVRAALGVPGGFVGCSEPLCCAVLSSPYVGCEAAVGRCAVPEPTAPRFSGRGTPGAACSALP